jgi:hypothetical protein
MNIEMGRLIKDMAVRLKELEERVKVLEAKDTRKLRLPHAQVK